jgi:ABC-type uncharacterized transport system permease subunit
MLAGNTTLHPVGARQVEVSFSSKLSWNRELVLEVLEVLQVLKVLEALEALEVLEVLQVLKVLKVLKVLQVLFSFLGLFFFSCLDSSSESGSESENVIGLARRLRAGADE